MLFDAEQFSKVEKMLKNNGTIMRFEQGNGSVRGRMMISAIDVPKDMLGQVVVSSSDVVFGGSFDFYDASIGMILNPRTKEAKSGIWITKQSEESDSPAIEWIEFFVRTLISNIDEDGSFGVPMYTFISDTGDFTVVPTK